jgi:hypothetical protein
VVHPFTYVQSSWLIEGVLRCALEAEDRDECVSTASCTAEGSVSWLGFVNEVPGLTRQGHVFHRSHEDYRWTDKAARLLFLKIASLLAASPINREVFHSNGLLNFTLSYLESRAEEVRRQPAELWYIAYRVKCLGRMLDLSSISCGPSRSTPLDRSIRSRSPSCTASSSLSGAWHSSGPPIVRYAL